MLKLSESSVLTVSANGAPSSTDGRLERHGLEFLSSCSSLRPEFHLSKSQVQTAWTAGVETSPARSALPSPTIFASERSVARSREARWRPDAE